MPDILTVALLTFVCGRDGYQDMSIFAEDMAEEFGLFKDCQGERPSADTFERVMSIIKPEEMQRCLKENGAALVSPLKNKHVAIDGKKLKGSNPKAKENKGLLRISYIGILTCCLRKTHAEPGKDTPDRIFLPYGSWHCRASKSTRMVSVCIRKCSRRL